MKLLSYIYNFLKGKSRLLILAGALDGAILTILSEIKDRENAGYEKQTQDLRERREQLWGIKIFLKKI
jgi:hypothetical protein